MSVTDLAQAEGLLHLDSGVARAQSWAYVQAHGDVLLPPVQVGAERWRLRWTPPGADAASHQAVPLLGWHALRFAVGKHEGWLLADPALATCLADDGVQPDVPHAIFCALAADTLGNVSRAVEAQLRQPVRWQPELSMQPTAVWLAQNAVSFSVCTDEGAARGSGAIAMDDLAGWQRWQQALEEAPDADTPHAARAVPTPQWMERLAIGVRFMIGQTQLRASELRGVAKGDIIAIEKWTSRGAALECVGTVPGIPTLGIAAHALGKQIMVDAVRHTERDMPDERNPAKPVQAKGLPGAATAGAPVASFDDIEVLTTFELAEQALPLHVLRNLAPGQVIELEQPLNHTTVQIRANGSLVGSGQLVAVGNRLAVRVSAFVHDTPDHA
ncbi:FliM/FliN family flagellar motor switch protein [Ralstonia chuxiongensis]|uniref:FliM/FliN family flagellar motor switch protein n=1 Tax=Ralstonia chuxiongensis TaxID=2957504 RepID=UPI00292D003F|nr:FliM/FliN family flagellar motor switch protein [Ralstonia chuxiongensis]